MTELLTEIIDSVPWWVRLMLAIVFMIARGLVVYFIAVRTGILLLGVGFVFLCFSGKSDSEKGGYNF